MDQIQLDPKKKRKPVGETPDFTTSLLSNVSESPSAPAFSKLRKTRLFPGKTHHLGYQGCLIRQCHLELRANQKQKNKGQSRKMKTDVGTLGKKATKSVLGSIGP